jgi:SAM-dependent methyltransferase
VAAAVITGARLSAARGESDGVSGAIQGCPTTAILDHTATVSWDPLVSWDPSAYGSAFADVYDDWYGGRDDVAAVVDTVGRLASPGRAARGRLLELGVGTGRLAIPLARAGFEVTGLDASAEMLTVLADKNAEVVGVLADAGVAADYPAGPFDVVIAAYNFVFNLPDRAAQARCLAATAQVAAPDGRLVLEAFVPEGSPPLGPVASPGPIEGVTIVSEVDIDAGVIRGEHRHADGRRRAWQVCPAGPEELDHMAAQAGWLLDDRWEDWACTPFEPLDSPTHVSVYRRSPAGDS